MKKWLKWEFWPFWFFYIPVYVKYLWLSLKAGTMTFFTASNPLMEFGGFTDYSKYNVLKSIHKDYLPETHFLAQATLKKTKELVQRENLKFPFIIKPDKGERGFGVEKINHWQDLENYFNIPQELGDLILQEYVDFPLELGIMYSRKASENSGKITSVVLKEFLSVTGNGSSTLIEIIETDPRASYYLESLKKIYASELEIILGQGIKKELVAIGNHCRGTTFLNANHLINEQLHTVFDKISLSIDGYHFGRYDLRVPSLEDLYAGKNIKIMELNGAASEPAHIYDPQMKLTDAYSHLFGHWQRLYEISIENNKNGIHFEKIGKLFYAIKNRGNFKKQINKNK